MLNQMGIHVGDGFPVGARRRLIPVIAANLADAITKVVHLMQAADVRFADALSAVRFL